MFLLSLLPLLLILYLMVARRWGAAQAGAAGWLAALLIAILSFGAGWQLLLVAHLKALLLAFDVLYIVWAAYLHFRVADEAGAIPAIGAGLQRLTRRRGMLALILGFAFASFLQGIGGFGVPVAIVAPMLIGLGFSPLEAVVVPAVGHAWSVTYGSLGSSFQALMAATGLPGDQLAAPAALLLGAAGGLTGLLVLHAADGMGAVRRLWGAALALGAGMAAVQYALAVAGFWNLASTGAGIAGLGLSLWLARRLRRAEPPASGARPPSMLLAISAYLILIGIMLGVQLIPWIGAPLGVPALRVAFPATVTDAGFATPAEAGRVIHWFAHGGALLLYSSVAGFALYSRAGWYQPGAARRILRATVRGVRSSTLGILAMVAMAVVMSHAGMTDTLARALAGSVGGAFRFVSPWIGALGAFITGSNTNANVVFGGLTLRAAELLGLAVPAALAAQTSGASIASVAAPTKIVVGAATAGMGGREGEIIRPLAGYILLLMLLVTALAGMLI